MGEEANPQLTATSFQILVKRDEVSPKLPLLQTEQPQFSQFFLVRLGYQDVLITFLTF